MTRDPGFERYGKRTRRDMFLAKMDLRGATQPLDSMKTTPSTDEPDMSEKKGVKSEVDNHNGEQVKP